ncbi:MAG: alpha/beta hydrolase [Cytophagaceae bacterium]|nr:alpha/beta hydrolase [Cytophagaceae bacterium]
MKKQIYTSIFFLAAILVFVQCTTSYKSIRNLKSMDELQYRDAFKKIHLPVSGYDIAYTDQGSGKTIIFIHGLGSYLPAWNRNVNELNKNYRCIAIDLPGYGKSSKEPHSGKMSFYAGIVKELVQELKLGKVYLAGHSMGGQISMTTHLLFPEIVEGLILVDPAGFETFNKGQKQWFRDVMTLDGVRLTTAEAIQSNLASNFYRVPKEADFMVTDRMAIRTASDFNAYCYAVVQSVSGMVNEPVLPYLTDIKCPTIIFFGENDNLIPNRYLNPGRTVEIAKSGANKISGSKLVMVPKAGHFMMFEKPGVFNTEVKNFLH